MKKSFLFYWGDFLSVFLYIGAFFWPDNFSSLMLLLFSIVFSFASIIRLVKAISSKNPYVFQFWLSPLYSVFAIVFFALLFHGEADSLRNAGFVITYWFIIIVVTTIARLIIWLFKRIIAKKAYARKDEDPSSEGAT